MADIAALKRELAVANRILARENVVDAFGHISVRHPDDPGRYFLSRSRSPELVEISDIMEFTLKGEPLDSQGRAIYAERAIHGGIYESRPDVTSVVHNHSFDVIPFGVTGVALRPLLHTAARLGPDIPTWDIADTFGDKTNLLVTTMEQGYDLAKCLGSRVAALMRGHGCVVVGRSIRDAVISAIYLQINARLQADAIRLGGPIKFLSQGEIEAFTGRRVGDFEGGRAWEYFVRRAGVENL
jgi:ribulose-5-phosphate 4-epimerase/fuculose-1-phosphate aldolase